MVNDETRMTVLAEWVADQHERLHGTCLLAPDGETTCQHTATHRVTFHLLALDGDLESQPVTFACAEHVEHYRTHPGVASIREVNP